MTDVIADKKPMQPAMAEDEIALLKGLLLRTRRYMEYGCGGSTYLACGLVREAVVSVDSAQVWVDQMRAICDGTDAEGRPNLVPDIRHVDVGPVRKWGYPANGSRRAHWPEYHGKIWQDPQVQLTDFCLVDGRFRVASAMQVLLNSGPDCLMAVHDYDFRPAYAPIAEVAELLVQTRSLYVFRRPKKFDPAQAEAILHRHAYTAQ